MSCKVRIDFRPFRVAALAGLALVLPPAAAAEEKPVTYAEDVQPILRENCFACHNIDDPSSDLALDSYESLRSGGASGEIVASGDPSGSRIWLLVSHQETPKMPPGDQLDDDQLDVIRRWIETGIRKDRGSEAVKVKKSGITAVDVSTDNKPEGEPAMPKDLWREPLVSSSHADAIAGLAASPWAPLVAISGQRQVSLYHADSGKLLGILPFVEGTPEVIRFSRDGSLLVVGGGRGASLGIATLYDVETGRRLITVGDELDVVLAADVSPDLSLVALAGPRKVVRIFDTRNGELKHEIRKHTDWVHDLEFSPDGQFLATAGRAGGLVLWEAATARQQADLRGHDDAVRAVSWRSDSKLLASASLDGTVRLWKPDGDQAKSWKAHAGGATDVDFAPDGRLVSTGRDKKVVVWSGEGKAVATVAKMDDEALAAAFLHDENRIVAGDYHGNVRLVDIAEKKQLAELAPNPPALARRAKLAADELAAAKGAAKKAKHAWNNAKEKLAASQDAVEKHQSELASANKQLQELVQQKQQATQQLGKAAEEFRAAAEEATGNAEALAEAESTLAEAAASDSQSDPADSPPAIEQAENAVKAARAAAQESDDRLGAVQSTRQDAQAVVAAFDQQWKSARQHLQELHAQAEQLPDTESLRNQVDELHGQLDTAQAAVTAATDAHEAAVAEQKAFSAWRDTVAGQIASLEKQASQAAASLEKVQAEHRTRLESMADRETVHERLAQRLKALQAEFDESAGRLAEARQQAEAKQQEASDIQAEIKQAKSRRDAVIQLREQLDGAAELRHEYASRASK